MSSTLNSTASPKPITHFGPDFPFAFDDWISHPSGLGTLPSSQHGEEVAIVGAGMAGMVAAYELMKLGLKPVIYEASKMGGRLRSQRFEGTQGVVAELGGMRFPVSSTAFHHYLEQSGLQSKPFPNPLSPATPSTVVDLEGWTTYAKTIADLPPLYREVASAWEEALEEGADFAALQTALRARDVKKLKAIWDELVPKWDDRTFYGYLATSKAFSKRGFRHLEVFGQVGFGTGGSRAVIRISCATSCGDSSASSTRKYSVAPGYGGASATVPRNARPAVVGFTNSWLSQTSATTLPSR